MNNKESFVDLIYEIAPESPYWADIVSDLEKLALRNFESKTASSIDDPNKDIENEMNVEQRETLCSILPHLQRVMAIQKKLVHLEQQRELATGLLESMPVGILVVDQDGKIISLNRVAKKLFEKSGLIRDDIGQFLIGDLDFPQFFASKKHSSGIVREDSVHEVLKNDVEELSILITLSRLKNHFIVFLSDDLGRETISRESLQKLFPVTNSEADLCVHLINGHCTEDIAQMRHTSVQTIRTQFKSIFRKTRTAGQVQLVRKILTSLARISPEDYEGFGQTYVSGKFQRNENKTLKCADGRRIGYAEYGNPDGYPIIFCHSLFGSRFEYPAHEILGNNRIIIPERPGYGLSDTKSVSDYMTWLDDFEIILQQLEIDKFAIAGLSSGAIYASAVASKMPERVSHLSLLSMTPKLSSWQDLKHVSTNLKFFGAFSLFMPQVARLLFEKEVKRLRGNPAKVVERITDNKADKCLLMTDSVFSVISKNYQQSMSHDVSHLSNEIVIHAQPWGFSFSDIKCPVDIWSGELDFHAPYCLVERTIADISNKAHHHLPDKGHFFFYELWSNILDVAMRRKMNWAESAVMA